MSKDCTTQTRKGAKKYKKKKVTKKHGISMRNEYRIHGCTFYNKPNKICEDPPSYGDGHNHQYLYLYEYI